MADRRPVLRLAPGLAEAVRTADLDDAFRDLAQLTPEQRRRLGIPPRESQINDPNTEH